MNTAEKNSTPVTSCGLNESTKVNQKPDATAQTKPQSARTISDPNQVAQLVMMRIDQVNTKKDELTIAVKGLADTAKQLVNVYAQQQQQIARLVKRVDELEKKDENQ